jgi:hypothetical protein
MAVGPRSGSEVLLQDEAAVTCKGFVDVGFSRPARILVHRGMRAAAPIATRLGEALEEALRGLGAARPHHPPCLGRLRGGCIAGEEPYTLNLLVWVGDGTVPNAFEEDYVRAWLASGGERHAIAVVPGDANLYRAIPPALARQQVVRWDGDAERAALDVIGVASVDSAERRVFISYSHADGTDLALAVNEVLTRERFTTFFDSFDLDPGVDFAERIEHELMEAAFLVLIETPGAIASQYVVEEEVGFARAQRLGVASVRPVDSPEPPLPGFAGWRWDVPKAGPGGPLLDDAAKADLGDFVVDRHERTITYRRWALESSLRAAPDRRRVDPRRVSGFPGGIRVDANGASQYVSLRPRPAQLVDMHAAFHQTPAGAAAGMVSATPRGHREREALAWLGGESAVSHHDEGSLGRLAALLAEGRL